MKKIFLTGVFACCLALGVKAQYASLTQDEFGNLKNLIATDANAKASFKMMQNRADKAMGEHPNPIDRITSEGKLAGDPAKERTIKACEDLDKIYALAVVYRLTGTKIYLDKASEYLLAWAKTNQSTGDPIDETRLEPTISGYDMIRNEVSPEVKKAVDAWMLSIADGELNSKYAVAGRGTANNNWNSHRIKIIAMIGYVLGENRYEKLATTLLEKQIAVNLYADGSGHDFAERDALHYHIYTLEPLILAAEVIYRATGKNYFNYESSSGSSIRKSIDFLVPFVTGEKTHGEFANSKTEFDRKRAANGEKEYVAGSAFKPLSGIHVLEEAGYFDPKYLDVVKRVVPADNAHLNDWEIVLDRVRKPVN